MRKILFLFLILISVAAIILTFVYDSEISNKDSRQSAELNTLYTQYNHTEYRIKYNESKINSILPGEAGVFFVFDQLTDNLTDTAKKLLDIYEYTGVIVITNTRMPGMKGMLSEEKFTELIETGWEVAIGFENDFTLSQNTLVAKNELNEYIKNIKENDVIRNSGANINIAVFASIYNQYNNIFDEILENEDIHTVISHNSLQYTPNNYFTGDAHILKISCIEFNMSNTIQSNLSEKISSHQPIAVISKLIEDNPLNNYDVSTQKYKNLLAFVNEQDKESLFTGTFNDFYLSKLDKYADNRSEITAIIEEIEKDKKSLEELDEEIRSILKQTD